MEEIKITKPITKKVNEKSSGSLSNIIENEKNSYKYTKYGAIRQSWIRDEAKRERSGNDDIIAVKVKEEILRLEQKKLKENEKERLKIEKKNQTIKLREEKKAKIKSEKIDMRGKTEKSLAHNKKQGSRLQEGIYMKMKKKELERDRLDSGSEEEITIIKKKRSKSRTPDIDYRKYYEDNIKKKIIKEEKDESPNLDRIRDLQRNIFKGII